MADATQPQEKLAVGSPAPQFSLTARSGKTITLGDFAGKNDVLVYFYPKDDTPGCTKEACSLRDAWKEIQNAGIVVLGISRDDAASHNAFASKYSLPFDLLTDADHSVHEAYGAWGQNPNPLWGVGVLRKSFLVGKDGKIRHVFSKVDTEHHAEQVLSAIGVSIPKPPAPAAKPAVPPASKPAAPPLPRPAAPPMPKPAAPPAPAPAAPAPAAKPAAPAPRPAAPAPAPKPAAAVTAPARPPAPKAAPKKAVKKKAAPRKAKAAPKKKKTAKKAARKAAPRKAARKPAKKAAVRKAAKRAPKKRTAKRAARKAAPKKKKR